jgi:hypothetical protein
MRLAAGADARSASKSAPIGCMQPKPASEAGRPEPSRYSPSGMLIAGGEATKPMTCGAPRAFARMNACVVAVPSDTTRSYGGFAEPICVHICASVAVSPAGLKRSIVVPDPRA